MTNVEHYTVTLQLDGQEVHKVYATSPKEALEKARKGISVEKHNDIEYNQMGFIYNDKTDAQYAIIDNEVYEND